MSALLLLLTATWLGLAVAAPMRIGCGPWTRAGIGIAFGQLLLLWVPFLLAVAFDLGARAAGLATTATLAALGAVAAFAWPTRRQALRGWLAELLDALTVASNRFLLSAGSALLMLLGWLHYTHYLRPRADGLHSAGVTWGDLPIHLALASRFLHAHALPPLEHPLFLHGPLTYPFLPDYSAAVLAASGLPLRWAFIVGGLCPLACLLLLIQGIVRLWIAPRGALVSLLTLGLFFLAGGLGFWFMAARWLDGAPALQLLATTNATYDISPHIIKSGHIGNLFLAARTASFGMPLGLAALLLVGHVLQQEVPARGPLALAGLFAGSLPLVHAHSFLVVCGALCFYVLLGRRFRISWAFCLLPLLGTALPQLRWLLSAGGPSFVRFVPGFLRPAPSAGEWLADLGLGVGLELVLLPIAFVAATPHARRLATPLLLLLPLANFMTFTPTVYDNTKLVAWFDLGAAPLVAALLARFLEVEARGTRRGLRVALGWLAVLGCTLSGALAVGYELTNDAFVISYADMHLAELVSRHTEPSAVVATAGSYHDPVAMLSGRRVLIATPSMLATHAIDVRSRARDLVTLYMGGDRAREIIARFGVSAVVIGPHERADLPRVNEPFFQSIARAKYEVNGNRLYLLER